MIHLFALLSGLIFGIGLCLSGMTDPGKVLGFLDLAGNWDPSLILVMGGAVAVGLVTFAVAAKRASTYVIGTRLELPQRRDIDVRLVAGSMTFGVGWGLAGICPGPAIALIGLGKPEAAVFVAAMLAGMVLYDLTSRPGRVLTIGEARQDS